jgi:hypothetical protein
MNDQLFCSVCNSQMQLIPAGVSKKTGKPYNSFLVCPNKCKPDYKPSPPPQPANPPTVPVNDTSDVNDKIIRQTCIKAASNLFMGTGKIDEAISAAKKFENFVNNLDLPF